MTTAISMPVMRLPSDDYRHVALTRPPAPPKGADAVAHRIAGVWRRRKAALAVLKRDAEAIDARAVEFGDLDDAALRTRMNELAAQFRRGRDQTVSDLTQTALAAVREAAHRVTGMRPFLVQLMGALALDRGWLAEMATGEGKTLTAALAAVLAGWRGRPCHVITVNDYLAERDARWFERLYRFCGLNVGHVVSTMDPVERRRGYAAEVTYTTSKEVVADFLRDRLLLGQFVQPGRRLIRDLLGSRSAGPDLRVMRGLHTAIVDEADSVLIDEAVTPLIICKPQENDSMREAARIATELAAQLVRGQHYRIDVRYREVELLDSAMPRMEEQARRMPQMWSGLARRRELVVQALVAREFFHRDAQYVVQDGKIVIVDEFTGRLMPQRTWREGLHQAIEAKEKIELTAPTEILARLSFQRFFRLYRHLAGMSGTVRESASELWQIYRLPVIEIPTNRPCARAQWPDRFFADEQSKWQAVVDEIAAVHAQGRPILAGTRSVGASEELARRLGTRGLHCHVLNAVRHAEEARIIASAGEACCITIATNMAGRGTDILLGKGVAASGGLHVIATEPNESGRIDRQLFGRAGRQGNPGSARRFATTDDDLLRRYVADVVRHKVAARISGGTTAVRSTLEQAVETIGGDGDSFSRPLIEPTSVQSRGARTAKAVLRYAQLAAQWQAARQRSAVMIHDTWLDEALSFSGPDATS